MPATPKAVVRSCGGRPTPVDFTFTGVGFTDGAVRGGPHSRARRAGWSAVLVGSGGEVVHGFYGSCPDAFPTSLRAELWGLIKILELALPPLTVYVDNAGVVDGVRRGQAWCTAAARPAADLWRKVWRKLDDIGGGIVVLKCKGHATAADIAAGRATALTKAGNDHADFFAGGGAIIAEHGAPAQHVRDAYSEARRWYRWLAELAAHWPADAETRQPKLPSKSASEPVVAAPSDKGAWRTHHESPHRIVEAAGRLSCEVCSRFANAGTARTHRSAFAKSACQGSLPDLARKHAERCRRRSLGQLTDGPSSSVRLTLTPLGQVAEEPLTQAQVPSEGSWRRPLPERRAALLAACLAACREPIQSAEEPRVGELASGREDVPAAALGSEAHAVPLAETAGTRVDSSGPAEASAPEVDAVERAERIAETSGADVEIGGLAEALGPEVDAVKTADAAGEFPAVPPYPYPYPCANEATAFAKESFEAADSLQMLSRGWTPEGALHRAEGAEKIAETSGVDVELTGLAEASGPEVDAVIAVVSGSGLDGSAFTRGASCDTLTGPIVVPGRPDMVPEAAKDPGPAGAAEFPQMRSRGCAPEALDPKALGKTSCRPSLKLAETSGDGVEVDELAEDSGTEVDAVKIAQALGAGTMDGAAQIAEESGDDVECAEAPGAYRATGGSAVLALLGSGSTLPGPAAHRAAHRSRSPYRLLSAAMADEGQAFLAPPVAEATAATAACGQHAHQLFISGTLSWCNICGAYGHGRLRGLLRSCPGPIAGRHESGRAASLRRLRGGWHPKTGALLPGARPLR